LTIWVPSTCDCKLEYNDRVNWVKTWNKCRLHNSLDGQALLDTVMAQCRRFSYAFPNPQTDEQINLISNARGVNKMRIRTENLDNFDEHLPFEQPLSFFQNLRRLLRLNP